MELPEFSIEDLAQLRMTECQGTLIGGMVIAGSLGMSPEDYGYHMMTFQRIRWKSIAGNLNKIANIFTKYYQVTYGFGSQLTVKLEEDLLQFKMPSISMVSAGQLDHWDAEPAALESVQHGFWRALETHANVIVSLDFNSYQHTVTIHRV